MRKKSLIALGAIAVVFAAFALFVATRPAEFRIARTATIAAPAAAVFAQVNDFHNWEGWSPWAKLDPEMKVTYGGESSGVGATYEWSGNDKVGEGLMTIAEVRPGELVRIDLEFQRPMATSNTAEFTFVPEGDRTVVTWSMAGKNNFIAKAAGLFLDIDEMVGGDFEKGLAQMKVAAESAVVQ